MVCAAFCLSALTVLAEDYNTPHEPSSPCSQLVAGCFELFGVERSRCFFTSSTHPFCEGTALGQLTSKRWMISPEMMPPSGASAFLGPQFIDQECLENFDNLWLGMLLDQERITDRIPALDAQIDSCKKELSNNLTRP